MLRSIHVFLKVILASVSLTSSGAGADLFNAFQAPEQAYYPETWYHLQGSSVNKDAITVDLEELKAKGFSGVQVFHTVTINALAEKYPAEELVPLSDEWVDVYTHIGNECERLGLRLVLHNCPGWSLAGGPWNKPENAMRRLTWSETFVDADSSGSIKLEKPPVNTHQFPVVSRTGTKHRSVVSQKEYGDGDYRDMKVIAFQSPENIGEEGLSILADIPRPTLLNATNLPEKARFFDGDFDTYSQFSSSQREHVMEIEYDAPVTVRSLEVYPEKNFYSMGRRNVLTFEIEAAEKTDSEYKPIGTVSTTVSCWHDMGVPHHMNLPTFTAKKIRFKLTYLSGGRWKLREIIFSPRRTIRDWTAKSGLTFRTPNGQRSYVEAGDLVSADTVIDLTSSFDPETGILNWKPESGQWTVLRMGHVWTGKVNKPTDPVATGPECDKLDRAGAETHFKNGMMGMLTMPGGPLYGKVQGQLIDSWETGYQTWTKDMPEEFKKLQGYDLEPYLPALSGFIVQDEATTEKFYRDYRATLAHLYTEQFFRVMEEVGQAEAGIGTHLEQAQGDVITGDPLQNFKYISVPMTEFSVGMWPDYGKPTKNAVSAQRLYNKDRLAAEAFTATSTTWEETPFQLKALGDRKLAQGVNHFVFHTYAHNPLLNVPGPGPLFWGRFGYQLSRRQTWWEHQLQWNTYLARSQYLLRQGRPVADVLYYAGDHKERFEDLDRVPGLSRANYDFDWLNLDLLRQLQVREGKLTLGHDLGYPLLVLPERTDLLLSAVKEIKRLLDEGAHVLGAPSTGSPSLSPREVNPEEYRRLVSAIWGDNPGKRGQREVGQGNVYWGETPEDVLARMGVSPAFEQEGFEWWQQRVIGDRTVFYVSNQQDKDVVVEPVFRAQAEHVEVWDAQTGTAKSVAFRVLEDGRTSVDLSFAAKESLFVVFSNASVADTPVRKTRTVLTLNNPWTVTFPALHIHDELQTTMDSLVSLHTLEDPNMKHYSGTVSYETNFSLDKAQKGMVLDLGEVRDIANVYLNGALIRKSIWAAPFECELPPLEAGRHQLKIEVTNTWKNRMTTEKDKPANDRDFWTTADVANKRLIPAGLLGPVTLKK